MSISDIIIKSDFLDTMNPIDKVPDLFCSEVYTVLKAQASDTSKICEIEKQIEQLKSLEYSIKQTIELKTKELETLKVSIDPGLPPSPPRNHTFDLLRYLKKKKSFVDAALEKTLPVDDSNVERIVSSMNYSLLAGGKRIRPILCLTACEMFGGTDSMAMPTAVALEMVHTSSLIHDDLPTMDNDKLRRGKPTNHVVYGEDIAILAGDALLSTSIEYLAKHSKDIPAARLVEVIHRITESIGVYGLVGGQVKDLECENKEGVTLEDLEWIHLHKTASLLKVSVAVGALIAGATPEEVKACEVYGEKVGLAFQIADDILDCTASSMTLGKTAGKDESVNKTTYVKLLGLENSRNEAQRYINEAKDSISIFGERAIPLQALADFIVSRNS